MPVRAALSDRRFVLALAGALLLVILLVSFLAPNADDTDPAPTTYNAGSSGIKAAYLLLGELGYSAERWEGSIADLSGAGPASSGSDPSAVDPAVTTLILANPYVPPADIDEVKRGITSFLDRGGRILVTGIQGAYLIPGGRTTSPTQLYKSLCFTTPEGQAPLALAGKVTIDDDARWADTGPASRVQQWCGTDAVVVSTHIGRGEAIWWSSPLPMTNRGLRDDASLKLLLASAGAPGRRVLFDESLHAAEPSLWETARGLPVRALFWQTALVALLLVLSFGRRNGPVWISSRVVRTSPLEFAESMGHLYNKARASQVATDGARRRLLRFLHERCGLPQALLNASPEAFAEAVSQRLGGDWTALAAHLTQAQQASETSMSPRSALALVQALNGDMDELRQRLSMTRG